MIDTITVTRSGKVRRAKLYYLRDRTGKSARIVEKIRKKIGVDIEVKPEAVIVENVAPAQEAPKEEAKNKNETKVHSEQKKESSEEKK